MQAKHKQLFIVFFVLFFIGSGLFAANYFNNRPKPVPEEAQAAHRTLQRIRAATQTGVTLDNYSQLVIDAKTAVNMAEPKLPAVTTEEIKKTGYDFKKEHNLESINSLLQEVMKTYQDAGVAWRSKRTGKNLIETEEGKIIQANYNIPNAEMEADNVIQILWGRAEIQMLILQSRMENKW